MKKLFTTIFMCVMGLAGAASADFCCPSNLCYPYYGELGIGYDYFRSTPEGSWEGNSGAFAGANIGLPVPFLDEYGLGAQVGGSYGIYDWSGRGSSSFSKIRKTQQQAFVTTGIFRRSCCDTGFNAGVVYDWNWNKNAGVFALSHCISQIRFQGGYQINACNEVGVWGTTDLGRSHRVTQGLHVSFRAISQVNLFWTHYFQNCSRTTIWGGIPYKRSLLFSHGRAGKYVIGASIEAPLTSRISIEGHASYMKGHSARRELKQITNATNICLEVKWSFGEGCEYKPYMPIANNSNFIVDTSTTY